MRPAGVGARIDPGGMIGFFECLTRDKKAPRTVLKYLSKPEVNIITIEDPVEYRITGVNQMGVNRKAGLTFATGLRSILRADPDIIMVGEMRDRESAHIAIEAALTGHLVLSTLHTNGAPETIRRLMNMGIEPFLVASSVHLICAQRLVRRVCANCKEPNPQTPEALMQAGADRGGRFGRWRAGAARHALPPGRRRPAGAACMRNRPRPAPPRAHRCAGQPCAGSAA